MLIRFTVGNYFSFKDKQTITFKPEPIKELEENIGTATYKETKLLKAIGLFGANASGKSNLLKALTFVKKFGVQSAVSKHAHQLITNIEPFKLSTQTRNEPSHFEIEFCIDEIRYIYGLEVDSIKVHKEWLLYSKKTKDLLIFRRENDSYTFGKSFEELNIFKDKTRGNATFLSVISQFNHKTGVEIVNWLGGFKILLDNISDTHLRHTANLIENDKYRNLIYKLLKNADVGINKIKTRRKDSAITEMLKTELRSLSGNILSNLVVQDLEISAEHNVYNEKFELVGKTDIDLKNESQGTQKFFAMAGRISEALINGSVLIIDEIDSRLHPLLSTSIVKYFNSATHNKKNAQLIFATHNISFLSSTILRRDQIYFTEKNRFEESNLISFVEKRIRSDSSYSKNYLQGKYGGIPYIDEQLSLFEDVIFGDA